MDHRQGTAFAYFNWARLLDFQLHADVQHAADHANLRYDAEKRPQHDGPAAIVDVREYGSMPSRRQLPSFAGWGTLFVRITVAQYSMPRPTRLTLIAQVLRGWRVVQVLHSLPCASAANEHTYHLYFASDGYRRAYMRKWTFGPCVRQLLAPRQ